MTPHVDILSQSEPLRRPLLGSVVLHASLVAAALVGSYLGSRQPERWGDPDAINGAVGVNTVAGLPMRVREGRLNPLANDTESQIPQPPPDKKPAEAVKEVEDPKAVPIGRDEKKKRDTQSSKQRYRPDEEVKPNQVYSDVGQALVSPLMGKPGSGGVGVGAGSPLGDRFGAYASLLQRLVAERWNTTGVDSRIRTAPYAKVQFTIQRDGTIRDIALGESSGIRALDLSAMRALYDLGKAPPLPPTFERSEARIEIWFQLRR